ncbi:MAG TPA: hypothetical protein ENK44_11435 [Caldithrix abyssi]|uniref:Polymer-forming cytoskeletal protein n=1 Tax=Caldithrix abyssi TaxID=187145 RepID=A0A7V4U1G7_CALAY|nr:hypothetical protein [Caldithrix abyssi]
MYKYAGFLLLFFAHLLSASSTTYKSNESFGVSANDSLPGDLFYGGRYLNVNGAVQGDVIAGAQQVSIEGRIEDDVYAWAEVIRVDGDVGDILLGFAKEIIVTGKVHGDIIAYGGSVRLLDGAEVAGNVYVGSGYFSLHNAVVHGNIFGGAGKVHLNGTVGGDIDLSVGDIDFGTQFSSQGKVEIELPEEPADPLENAPSNLQITVEPETPFYQEATFYYFMMAAFVIGAILLGIFPMLHENLALMGSRKIGPILLSGTAFVLITPLVTVFALLFLPLAFIMGALYFIIMYLSKIFSAYILGDLLFKNLKKEKKANPYLSFFTGLVILTLLIQIPVTGFFIWLLAFVAGSGSFIYYLYSLRKNGSKA